MEQTKITSAYQEVIEQHEELHGKLEELRRYLEGARPDVGTEAAQRWASGLSERLLVLHNKLFTHFQHEESSGFMQELIRSFPRAANAVEALIREHDRILQDLNAILSAAITYSEQKAPENPNLRRWIFSLMENLRRHEREETELFQRLLYEELGTKD